MPAPTLPFYTRAMHLLTRLERAETRHLTLYGGEVAAFGAVRAVYAGPEVPINVAAGFEDAPEAPLDELEAFYAARGLPARLLLYSQAHAELLARLAARGYHLARVLHAYARPLDQAPAAPTLTVRRVPGEVWAPVAARAFGPGNEAIMELTARRTVTRLYLASMAEEGLGVAALSVLDGVAILHGAATLPEARRRGAQAALIAARLRDAAAAGAEVASVLTTPGSASERNVRRAGFGLAGARLSFER